jgi:hypothetical protein
LYIPTEEGTTDARTRGPEEPEEEERVERERVLGSLKRKPGGQHSQSRSLKLREYSAFLPPPPPLLLLLLLLLLLAEEHTVAALQRGTRRSERGAARLLLTKNDVRVPTAANILLWVRCVSSACVVCVCCVHVPM